jgi:hypothetical protein
MGTTEIVTWAIRGLVVLVFLALGARELAVLFRKHDRRMGRGWARVWAVARATVFEAWAGRVWLLPVLWFGAGMLLLLAARPFDESERIPLYIKALLSSQEALLLIMMWVMACVSLPRERERKILVTNASKPLSRLEIILGKIVGFGVVAAGALAVMGAVSLVILGVSDLRVRGRAKAAYDLQVRDYNKNLVAPSEALLQLSEEGSLFSYNYITVPQEGMNIGVLSPPRNAEDSAYARGFIGGTNEKVIYQFAPRLLAHELTLLRQPGRRPFFVFYYAWRPVPGMPRPDKVQIRVTAYVPGPGMRQEKELTLNDAGLAYWEPAQPEDLFSAFDNHFALTRDRGMVTVEVTCLTPGVIMPVLESADPDADGKLPAGTETNIEFYNRQEDLQMGLPQEANLPKAHPSVRGFERRERQEVAGPTEKQPLYEQAIYRFPGSSLRHVPVDKDGNFQLSLQLETYKSEHPELATVAGVTVRSLDRKGLPPFENLKLEVREKRVMTLAVPAENLGNKDPNRRGDMLVIVRCMTSDHSVTMIENSVRIELPRTPFFVNWMKCEAVIFLEALLLIALAVTCSVRLGWPVALLCSGVCYVFGYMQSWILSLPEYGGLGALNYHPGAFNPALFHFFDQTASLLWATLGFLAILVPDFTRFQPQEYIGRLQNMPWSVLAGNLTETAGFVLPFIALAYLLFRKQELG